MRKLIIANWKMNPKTARDAIRLASAVGRGVKNAKNVETVLAPPFVHIDAVRSTLRAMRSNIKIGAQDAFWERQGAYTGEISALQLRAYGARFVIAGHSERRALGETNEIINKKLRVILESGSKAVLCVGEREKRHDIVFPEFIKDELRYGLKKIKKAFLKNLIIAYEPVWAISSNGRGRADDPRNVYEMSLMIRRELYKMFGRGTASKIPILYGGSVDDNNALRFVKEGAVDGLLVGGASLNAKKIVKIVRDAGKL